MLSTLRLKMVLFCIVEAFTITELDLKHLCNLEYHVREDGTRCEPAIPGFTPTTTNESLARLLVKELGPIQAIGILNSVTKDTFDLPATFYYDCMRVAEKEQQQRYATNMIFSRSTSSVTQHTLFL